ncbi:MAG: hypothetical protein FJY10_09205 [Bacteroidetes bacterium]|nr:hypothetical protein [Bacteroidota bacterium]
MPLYLASINSGSNGNCYYIGTEDHLSNNQSLELFLNNRSPDLQFLVLSHLSAHNNHPEIVHRLFSSHANGTRIEIASRYEETEVFYLSPSTCF